VIIPKGKVAPFQAYILQTAILIALLLLCFSHKANAQTDSLERLLDNNSADTGRVEILIELFRQLRNSDPIRAEQYNKEALNLSEYLGYEEGTGKALNNYGVYHKNLGEYDKALDFYLQALKVEEALDNDDRIAFAYSNIGTIYTIKKEYDRALESFENALEIFEKIGNEIYLIRILNNIGLVYYERRAFDEALNYYDRALKISEDYPGLVGFDVLSNIGNIYNQLKNYDQAIEFYQRSLLAEISNNNKYGQANALLNIGETYRLKGSFVEAEEYLDQSVEIARELGNKPLLSSIFRSLSDLYLEKGDILLAYSMLKNHMKLKDSIFNEESAQKLAELETLYEVDKKEKEIQLQKLQIRNQNLLTFAVIFILLSIIVVAVLIYLKFIQNKKAKALLEVQNEEITKSKSELEKQKHIIEEKNRDITDSINYAKGVQDAILNQKEFEEYLNDAFIYFRPKDIVSGDFYWYYRKKDYDIIAAVDCTGHGVAGAFMTIIGNSLLNQIVVESEERSPAKILKQLDDKVMKTLAHRQVSSHGMDAAICCLDRKKSKVVFAGAKRPLYQVLTDGELREFKGNKVGIGDELSEMSRNFDDKEITFVKGDTFYMFSDGYPDQFGGPVQKKFMTRRFKKLIVENNQKEMREVSGILSHEMSEWMNGEEQTDDMLVIGFRV
jgi:serine phosphatase RsbU (regulator of sigma subunit)